ncbi:hypothetical protein HU200_012557 [Digitaria exilis]|uniref:Uncharacterized protein n=1 Tax=Digitaria exilis TaxID=1010633 RepID=A0A835KN46_9POAL|nr:hypothetical protein HU200_012557 [Digitaria exilis]
MDFAPPTSLGGGGGIGGILPQSPEALRDNFNPRYIDFVGDNALLTVAARCRKLTRTQLASTSQGEDAAITVAGLIPLFAALPALEDFTLDTPVMEALVARRCQHPADKFLTLGCFQGLLVQGIMAASR